MKKQHVILTEQDRASLHHMLAEGNLSLRKRKRATALLELDQGKTLADVAKQLSVNYNAVAEWRNNYKSQGLKCLDEAPRSGRPTRIDSEARAKIIALAQTPAPGGRGWSLRQLAERVVEEGICDQVSHTFIASILKSTK